MRKLIILLLVFCFASNIVFAACVGQWTKLKKGYVATASKELFDKAVDIIMSKDNEALLKLMLTGLVTITDEKMEAYVVNTHPFGGTAEVRFRGDTAIWWTNIEALECYK